MKKNQFSMTVLAASMATLFFANNAYSAQTELNSTSTDGITITSNTDDTPGEFVEITEGGRNVLRSPGDGANVTIGSGGNTTVDGTLSVTNGATVVGTTSINATGTAATNIGNTDSASTTTVQGGNSRLSVANGAATTTVTSGVSILASPSQTTTGQMAIVNTGGDGATVDANGKITNGIVGQTTGSLVVTNGIGNTHGFVVNESAATMSGGVHSTSMTLNDNGARFSNSATGAPVNVTGVADGKADYDAVNVRQLRFLKRGLAATTAMVNIPQVDTGKTFALGMGVGGYDDEQALAFGASARFAENTVVRASVGHSFSSGSSSDNTTWGVGAALSW